MDNSVSVYYRNKLDKKLDRNTLDGKAGFSWRIEA